MLVWMSEGWFNHFQTLENPNIEASYEELMDCMELLKNAFYKSPCQNAISPETVSSQTIKGR